ncbi:rhodanese-like domain-containing protein [Aquitalea palustris]|uniref:Rhodanese-like domain-containing protein n=1 Tax=Aquitalea palustris TaxID=2480983 RepID=A0A454JD45_9NEIS|nr:rhodanese-like domain-containing protein [Aquitalea palustris]RMC91165.1 rhodanese-like domain-containing protein [Aquitalea palustris]
MTQLEFYQAKLAYEIDAADVKAALDAGEKLILIDTRATSAFARETIPGALSLPHRTMSAQTTAALPRDALLVPFCDGIGCNGSTNGAIKLLQLGFRVKELQGGLDWWKRDGYATVGSHAVAASSIHCAC